MGRRRVNYQGEQLERHRVEVVTEGRELSAYWLKRPDTYECGVMLMFGRVGIVMYGDLTPSVCNAPLGTRGYGLEWWLREMDRSYLCEKFLNRVFVPELAAEALAEPSHYLREGASGEDLRFLDELIAELRSSAMDEVSFCNGLLARFGWLEECPGYGHHPVEADWLEAIHDRFVAAWPARVGVGGEEGGRDG